MNETITNLKKKFTKLTSSILYKDVVVSVDNNGKPTKTIKKKRSKGIIYFGIFALLFGLSFIFMNYDATIQLNELGVIISKLFQPSPFSLKTWDRYYDYLFNTAFFSILQTLEMCYIGTLFGAIISIPLFLLSSSNVVKKAYIYMPIRFLCDIVRSIPTYVLALISVAFVGIGATAGIIAIVIFTAGIMFKLMYEYIDTLEMNAFEASLSAGANRLEAFKVSLLPMTIPMFISNFIYTFEINVRASIVLAWANAGGVGQLLKTAMEAQQFDKVGAILIPLFFTVIILQLLSSFLRRKDM